MTHSWTVQFALATVLVSAAVLTGCGGATDTGTTPETPPAATTDAPAGDASDAAALAQQKCTMCHSYERVAAANYDKAGWTDTVTRMQQNGCVLTEEEKTRIIDYLSEQ